MTEKFVVLKGGRKRDIYEDAKWRKRPISMDGEPYEAPSSFYDPYDEQAEHDELRYKALEFIERISNDPLDYRIAELMLENYNELDIAAILGISPARVELFMRKIAVWKKSSKRVLDDDE